jgi:hypothetical protein
VPLLRKCGALCLVLYDILAQYLDMGTCQYFAFSVYIIIECAIRSVCGPSNPEVFIPQSGLCWLYTECTGANNHLPCRNHDPHTFNIQYYWRLVPRNLKYKATFLNFSYELRLFHKYSLSLRTVVLEIDVHGYENWYSSYYFNL